LLQTINYAVWNMLVPLESFSGEPDAAGMAVNFFLLSLMAWLALASRAAATRWAHMVLGVLVAVVKLLAVIVIATDAPSFALIFNEAWGFAVAGLIIFYAWKLPKIAA
jgi:hypothetical protein